MSKIYSHYERCHQECHEEHNYLLGRVLTIIDASVIDSDQRKAVKDLIKGEFNDCWVNGYREHIVCAFKAAAKAFGDGFGETKVVTGLPVSN